MAIDKNTKVTNSVLFTDEEEELMSEFSKEISNRCLVLFVSSAIMVSLLPIWLYWRIHMMEMLSSFVLIVIVTSGSTCAITFAYKNIKVLLKYKIAISREEAVFIEVTKKYANDKKIKKKEKLLEVLNQTDRIADYEATTYSIFYNNILFLTVVIFLSFYIFRRYQTAVNYGFSVGIASGLTALLSTRSQ